MLTDTIKNQIRRWRSRRQRSTTIFHPDACASMHELLEDMDNFKLRGSFRGAIGSGMFCHILEYTTCHIIYT